MKKYLPLLLILMAGVFQETKPAVFVDPGNLHLLKMKKGFAGSVPGASGGIAILYLPE
jgi:hypothetical protein